MFFLLGIFTKHSPQKPSKHFFKEPLNSFQNQASLSLDDYPLKKQEKTKKKTKEVLIEKNKKIPKPTKNGIFKMISWCWLPPIGAFNGILSYVSKPYEALSKSQKVAPFEEINAN